MAEKKRVENYVYDGDDWIEESPPLTYYEYSAFGEVNLEGATLTKDHVFTGNIFNSSTATLTFPHRLYGGTYPNGKLYEWNDVDAWVEKAPKLGAETDISSLAVYNERGRENGRVLKEIFIEDHNPGARPPGSLVDVIIDNKVVGAINMSEDPHFYFKGWEDNNKSFGVRTVTLRPNATFGSSTVDVMAEYFYK